MKRFLAILIGATSCSLCTYAQNGYIVTTTSQQTSISVESLEKQFINDHFKYYNLCDWTPGMKFMVMPENVKTSLFLLLNRRKPTRRWIQES